MTYIQFIEHLTKSCPYLHKICPNFCDFDNFFTQKKQNEHIESKKCPNQKV